MIMMIKHANPGNHQGQEHVMMMFSTSLAIVIGLPLLLLYVAVSPVYVYGIEELTVSDLRYLRPQLTAVRSDDFHPHIKMDRIVPTLELDDPDQEFIEVLAKRDQPVIITNSVVKQWQARHWTPKYIEEKIGVDVISGIQTHSSSTFYYDHDKRPLASIPSIASERRAVAYRRVNMTVPDFMQAIRDRSSKSTSESEDIGNVVVGEDDPHGQESVNNDPDNFLYYAGRLENFPALYDDAYPPDYMMMRGGGRNPNALLTHVWIGQGNVTTQAHYDIQHNCYVQLYGSKRFYLWPPSEINNLYLYPYLHPGAQSSQVNMTQPDLKRFPLFDQARAWDATLNPGDVLYVPPLWFHHVAALSLSLSISIWTPFRDHTRFQDIQAMGLPWPGGTESHNSNQGADGDNPSAAASKSDISVTTNSDTAMSQIAQEKFATGMLFIHRLLMHPLLRRAVKTIGMGEAWPAVGHSNGKDDDAEKTKKKKKTNPVQRFISQLLDQRYRSTFATEPRLYNGVSMKDAIQKNGKEQHISYPQSCQYTTSDELTVGPGSRYPPDGIEPETSNHDSDVKPDPRTTNKWYMGKRPDAATQQFTDADKKFNLLVDRIVSEFAVMQESRLAIWLQDYVEMVALEAVGGSGFESRIGVLFQCLEKKRVRWRVLEKLV